MSKRKAKEKTPLKQTRISSFFKKDESSPKRFKPSVAESPDIILCSPPTKQEKCSRRSLGFGSNTGLIENSSEKITKCGLKLQKILTNSQDKNISRGESSPKHLKTLNAVSPDIILCTPPTKQEKCSRRSLRFGSITDLIDNSSEKKTKRDLRSQKIPTNFQDKNISSPKHLKTLNAESPDMILCTPPRKQDICIKRFNADVTKHDQARHNKEHSSRAKSSCSKVNNTNSQDKKSSPKTSNSFVAESPDIILSTPREKNDKGSRRSLLFHSNTENHIRTEIDVSEPKSKDKPVYSRSAAMEILTPSQEKEVDLVDSSKKYSLLQSPSKMSTSIDFDSLDTKLDVKRNKTAFTNLEDVFKSACVEQKSEDGAQFDSAFSEIRLEVLSQNKSPSISQNNLGLEDFAFDEGWESQTFSQEETFPLTFQKCVNCVVVSCHVAKKGVYHEQILVLKESESAKMGRCILRDMWALNVRVSPGDVINILAENQNGEWIVHAQHGYVCLYPDLLVSSTSLVSAMFCRRRGVLTNLFRGLDGSNKVMVIGQLVHELLQETLKCSSFSELSVQSTIIKLLTVPYNLRMLYSCSMSMKEAKSELQRYVPFIISFMETYVTGKTKPMEGNYGGIITDIEDIEENVCSMNLGIKGRIDVTVRAKIRNKLDKLPLEVKTGRASFSAEHRSQVTLYTMMMSQIHEKVESGLLLYLKEGVMQEIKPTYVEIRDLILLRNEFAQYVRQFNSHHLPEPIRLANACSKCPYLTVCTAYLDENTPEKHPIRSVAPEIKSTDLEYFHKWTQLVLLEDSFEDDKKLLKMRNLTLDDGVVQLNNKYKYSFTRDPEETTLSEGSFVVVSSKLHCRSYNGRIVHLSKTQCSILVERQIDPRSGLFNIEGFKISLLSRYLTNLGHLLEEHCQPLRNIVINREISIFTETMPKTVLSQQRLEILSQLNVEQQRAVLKVLTSQNYFLIEGPPGTGKTQTIVAMIRILLSLQQRVLLVGHTHSSVDNVLVRLPDVEFLRLGSLTSIRESLHAQSYACLIEKATSAIDVRELFNRSLIASTCLGLDDDIIARERFDVCIVDESSQVMQPEVLKPLFAAKKFVLIGDSKQLRPVVKNPNAKALGMDVSIFEYLEHPENVVTLTKQYRMNKTIMDLANNFTYNGILIPGSESVETQALQLVNEESLQAKWLRKAISCKIESSVLFIDTSDYLKSPENEEFLCMNRVEANIVHKLIETFLACSVPPEEIGVMAPYRAQVQLLSEILPSRVEVNTVDQYQGRDKSVIVFSCTKQNRVVQLRGENEILNDHRRLTVALTRAKHKLLIVGDKRTLLCYKTFQCLFNVLNENNFLSVKEGVDDFSWSMFST